MRQSRPRRGPSKRPRGRLAPYAHCTRRMTKGRYGHVRPSQLSVRKLPAGASRHEKGTKDLRTVPDGRRHTLEAPPQRPREPPDRSATAMGGGPRLVTSCCSVSTKASLRLPCRRLHLGPLFAVVQVLPAETSESCAWSRRPGTSPPGGAARTVCIGGWRTVAGPVATGRSAPDSPHGRSRLSPAHDASSYNWSAAPSLPPSPVPESPSINSIGTRLTIQHPGHGAHTITPACLGRESYPPYPRPLDRP